MPSGAKRPARSRADHSRPKKRPKPELSTDDKVKRLYHSIYDELLGQRGHTFPQNALKNVRKIIALRPDDRFAFVTQVQLLAGLDRYKEAYDALSSKAGETSDQRAGAREHPLEAAYVLYKLKREREALAVIEEFHKGAVALDDTRARGLRLLEAQILYRLEHYAAARTLYEELLEGVEPAAPEYADLNTNLRACIAHIEFVESLPSRLEAMSESLPTVQQLEATPLNLLVASHASHRSSATRGRPRPAFSQTLEAAKRRPRKKRVTAKHPSPTKLPAHVAALPPEKRPPPDPERWLPKRERSDWQSKQAELLRERERKRAEKRRNVKLATQGTMDSPSAKPASSMARAGAPSGAKKKKKAK